jgi:hypothetical protein
MNPRPMQEQSSGSRSRERRSRRLIVLGSTGSIGVNTLTWWRICDHSEFHRSVGLAADRGRSARQAGRAVEYDIWPRQRAATEFAWRCKGVPRINAA